MSSSRERSQTTKPNVSIPRGGRLPSLIFALSRNPNRLPPRTHAFFEMLEKATAREGRIGGESKKGSDQRSEVRGRGRNFLTNQSWLLFGSIRLLLSRRRLGG